jgi:hypothetical protein
LRVLFRESYQFTATELVARVSLTFSPGLCGKM